MSYPIDNFVTSQYFSASHQVFVAAIDSDVEPRICIKAVKDPKCGDAMAQVVRALEDNGTWTIETLAAKDHWM